MFSEQFAEEAIEMAALGPNSLVLDPWLGAGTTTAVAARNGLQSIGVDLNPAMIAIASGRCIHQQLAKDAIAIVEGASGGMKCPKLGNGDPLCEWFGPSAAGAIRGWHRLIQDEFPDTTHRLQSGFLLTALFEASWRLAEPYRSKNPTWVKRPRADKRSDCSARVFTQTVLDSARMKAADCAVRPVTLPAFFCGTSGRLALLESSVDFVLTSPPYCTRIDYAVTTSIELAVLGYGGECIDGLRDSMMGTSTIRRHTVVPDERWGQTCNEFLILVLNHISRSSASYYYKTYVQYFADLFMSLTEINRCAKPSAEAAIVVQSSRYKGNTINLARIVVEMMMIQGWRVLRQDDYDVLQTMQRVNTRSHRYSTDLTSVESVLWFKCPGDSDGS